MTEGKDKHALVGGSIQFYPPELWGLDYQFNTYSKMFIKDILMMEEYPMFPGILRYCLDFQKFLCRIRSTVLDSDEK